jgi:hypothetical protein
MMMEDIIASGVLGAMTIGALFTVAALIVGFIRDSE